MKSKPVTGLTNVVVQSALYTMIAGAVQLIGVAVFTLITFAFIGVPLLWFDSPLWLVLPAIFGPAIIGWAAVLFKTPMLKWWFCYNPPLIARVVGRTLAKDRIVSGQGSGPLKAFDFGTLREIGPRWHGKLPWEITVDKPIDLQSGIFIGNSIDKGNPLKARSKDGLNVLMGWQSMLTPLRGHLVHLVMFKDESQIQEFRSIFVEFLYGWAIKLNGVDIFERMTPEKINELRDDFKKLLGGKDEVVRFEEERGMFSGDPEFIGLQYDESYSKALQAKKTTELVGAGVSNLLMPFKGTALLEEVNPNLVMMMSAAAAGALGDMNPIVLIGAENADPGNLATTRELLKNMGPKGSSKKRS